MRVTVFGATGAIGRYVVDSALERGYEVRAFTRDASGLDPRERLVSIEGDATDEAAVARAVAGSDAVINALGPRSNERIVVAESERHIRNIVDGMRLHGVRRIVSLSGAAVTLAGEQKPLSARTASALVRLLARHVVGAKQREYVLLADSGLDWTLVRPPRVVDGLATATYVAGDRLAGRTVTRGAVAEYMVRVLGDPSTIGKAPYVSEQP